VNGSPDVLGSLAVSAGRVKVAGNDVEEVDIVEHGKDVHVREAVEETDDENTFLSSVAAPLSVSDRHLSHLAETDLVDDSTRHLLPWRLTLLALYTPDIYHRLRLRFLHLRTSSCYLLTTIEVDNFCA